MPVPELPPPENEVYYPALDGIRALAVLVVFLGHYLTLLPPALGWGCLSYRFFETPFCG